MCDLIPRIATGAARRIQNIEFAYRFQLASGVKLREPNSNSNPKSEFFSSDFDSDSKNTRSKSEKSKKSHADCRWKVLRSVRLREESAEDEDEDVEEMKNSKIMIEAGDIAIEIEI